ncbi:hypothetical protein DSM112329_01489 [Paraconexibacter sp. AEG42_29]|uniref:PucR family transcriptional regulator n=2 Tax=Paraconexibacter sp. AEG42_29 TaxID=2997339 RepID=A0AAU7ASR6_9ACTN
MRALAAELLEDVSAIAEHLTAFVMREVGELVQTDDPTWQPTVYRAARSNASAILAMLAEGVAGSAAETPVEARAFYERQAEHDDGLVTVLRTYRLGIAELWQAWAAHVTTRCRDEPLVALEILRASMAEVSAYQDRMAEESAAHWRDTRLRKQRGLDRMPAEIVRGALAGDRVDDLAKLGYPPGAEHLAVAFEPESGEAAAALAARIRTRLALPTVALSHDAAHVVWIAMTQPAITDDAVGALVEPGPAVGIGHRNPGPAGFRVSHREATDALRMGAVRSASGVTWHADVALVATLSADPDRARAFVRRELGPLGDEGKQATRLRDTVLVFLGTGESHVRAARQLGVHEKTVTYRVRQAEQLLGRRVADRRVELEAALMVHRVLSRPDAEAPFLSPDDS